MQLCFFLIDDVDAGEFYDEIDFPGFAYRGMNVLTTSDVPYAHPRLIAWHCIS
jgi:hypothetical protein